MPHPRVLFSKNFSVTAAQIRALEGHPYEVWASHTDPQHAMLAAAPNHFLEPRGLLGDAYAAWLLDACRARDISLVLPGKERGRLAAHRPRFAAAGVTLLVPADEATQRLLERKDEFLRDWDVRVLPIPRWTTFRTLAEFDAARAQLSQQGVRLCMKPARGIYASGFRVLLDRPDPAAFLRGELYQMSVAAARELLAVQEKQGREEEQREGRPLPTMLLMHTLEGAERSIDAVAWQGRLIGAVVRRKSAADGEGQRIEERPDLLRAAAEIARRYRLSGVFNFQTKDQPDARGRGVPHMLEINARASGGLRYSLAAGMNFPLLLLDAATGRLDWDALPTARSGVTVQEEKGVRVC